MRMMIVFTLMLALVGCGGGNSDWAGTFTGPVTLVGSCSDGSTFFRGGYYSRGRQFLAPLPMPDLDLTMGAGRAIHDRVVRRVRDLVALGARERAATVPRAKETAHRRYRGALDDLYGDLDTILGVPPDLRREIAETFVRSSGEGGTES